MLKTISSIIFLLSLSINTQACRCLAPNIEQAFESSDNVVMGKVIESVKLDKYEGKLTIVTVLKSWKGETFPKIGITSITNCSAYFKKGEEYLIFLSKEPLGLFSTNICSGNKLLNKVTKKDLQLLEQLKHLLQNNK